MTATRVFIFLEVHVRKRGLLGGLVDFFLFVGREDLALDVNDSPNDSCWPAS